MTIYLFPTLRSVSNEPNNSISHRLGISKNLISRNSQNLITLRLQKSIPYPIMCDPFWGQVRLPIDLDNQPQFNTKEINRISLAIRLCDFAKSIFCFNLAMLFFTISSSLDNS